MCWYNGSHLSFPMERSVRTYVDHSLKEMFDLPL